MMDKVFSAVQYILGLGPTIMLPIIIFIMAMCLQTGFSRALRSALTIGMGFIGIFLVFGLLVDSLGPAAKEMVSHTGIDLPVVDLGWTPLAAIAWASQVAPFVVPMTIGINVLMLTLNWTKTVDIDVWNFWHFSMVGAMVYGVTGNFFFGLLIAGVTAAITFVMADWCAPMIQKYFNLPGISLPTLSSVIFFPIGVLGNMVLDKIPGINKLNADPDQIQKRFGVFGEPMMLGVILGAGIGLLAEYDVKGVLNLAMSLGAVMLIMPRMVKLLMEGLLPLSDAVRSFLKNVILTVTICISVWISRLLWGIRQYCQLRCCLSPSGYCWRWYCQVTVCCHWVTWRTFGYRFPWWYWPVEAILSGRLSLAFHAWR